MNIAGGALFFLLCSTSVTSGSHDAVGHDDAAVKQPSKEATRRLRTQSSRETASIGVIGQRNFISKWITTGEDGKNDLSEIQSMLNQVFESETMSLPTPTKPPPAPAPTKGPTEPAPVPTVQITASPTFVCGISSDLRAEQIVIKMATVSKPADFLDPTSPQSKALEWIITEDALYLCPDDPKLVQRYVAAVFYYSTEGDSWKECSAPKSSDADAIEEANDNCDMKIDVGDGGTDAWLTPVSECNWGGLKCNPANDCLVRIDFEKNNLQGKIPFELQELKELRVIHMEEGETRGSIPSEIGTLSLLEELDLNFNLLNGPLPDELYDLGEMKELDLNDNLLQGSISSDIQKLKKLRFFQISKNRFTGTIPSEMGELTKLAIANFDRNRLTGSMPQEVCKLRDTENGVIGSLTSDCLDPTSQFFVECESPQCCTQCFEP